MSVVAQGDLSALHTSGRSIKCLANFLWWIGESETLIVYLEFRVVREWDYSLLNVGRVSTGRVRVDLAAIYEDTRHAQDGKKCLIMQVSHDCYSRKARD